MFRLDILKKLTEAVLPEVNMDRCIKAKNNYAHCDDCVTICPQKTISYTDNKIHIEHGKCTNCGSCLAVCPNSAIGLKGYDELNTLIAVKKNKTNIISCSNHHETIKSSVSVPCVGIFSREMLLNILLYAKGEKIYINGIKCHNCSRVASYESFKDRLTQVEHILLKMGIVHKVKLVTELRDLPVVDQEKMSRRALFSVFAQQATDTTAHILTLMTGEDDLPEGEGVSRQRTILINLLKERKIDNFHELNQLFCKWKCGENCTGCGLCQRICPTKAMQITQLDSEAVVVSQQVGNCIGCQLCANMCPTNSLQKDPHITIKEVTGREFTPIGKIQITECVQCGDITNKNQRLCFACQKKNTFVSELAQMLE